MNISDTFYVALCMTILIIGVVYWFWTQNQYIQRKLNLLENIVYEMKTNLGNAPDADKKADYPPAPSSELGEDDDLLHEELHNEVSNELPAIQEKAENTENAEKEQDDAPMEESNAFDNDADDLQPGGIGSSMSVELPADSTGRSKSEVCIAVIKREKRSAYRIEQLLSGLIFSTGIQRI